jgi:hypothetical protein
MVDSFISCVLAYKRKLEQQDIPAAEIHLPQTFIDFLSANRINGHFLGLRIYRTNSQPRLLSADVYGRFVALDTKELLGCIQEQGLN